CCLERLVFSIIDATRSVFFQAEDGIRALTVTGVQTCALPISDHLACGARRHGRGGGFPRSPHRVARQDRLRHHADDDDRARRGRSEERRVGKEWRSWVATYESH